MRGSLHIRSSPRLAVRRTACFRTPMRGSGALQLSAHPRERGDPEEVAGQSLSPWTPACAGVSGVFVSGNALIYARTCSGHGGCEVVANWASGPDLIPIGL